MAHAMNDLVLYPNSRRCSPKMSESNPEYQFFRELGS